MCFYVLKKTRQGNSFIVIGFPGRFFFKKLQAECKWAVCDDEGMLSVWNYKLQIKRAKMATDLSCLLRVNDFPF